MSLDDPELTYGAIRERVRQLLAEEDLAVDEAFITNTCMAIAAFAHEREAILEALVPDPGERQLVMLPWQDEIVAIPAIGDRLYQQALQRGEPLPLAEQAVNLRLQAEFFRLREEGEDDA